MTRDASQPRKTTALGPVSQWLEADVRAAVMRNGLIVWLDSDGRYTEWVDRLIMHREAHELSYDVVAFRGSHLRLMLALENAAEGVQKPLLVIHLPGYNPETVSQLPMLELYEAGTCYQRALDTVVTNAAAGRARPEQIAEFLASKDTTLEQADAWLAQLLVGPESGVMAPLRAMAATAVLDDLLTGGFVAGQVGNPQGLDAVWQWCMAALGLPGEWRAKLEPPQGGRAADIAFVAAGWAQAVEYVHDLKRNPLSPLLAAAVDLPKAVVETCRSVAEFLRERHAAFYQHTADTIEVLLADEVDAARAEDLGKIDTFRFEEHKVLQAALEALATGNYEQVLKWAALREGHTTGSASYWLRQDLARQSVWFLVRDAARLGLALGKAGPRLVAAGGGDFGLDEAVRAYTERGAAVDFAHRQLEQQRRARLLPQMPEFETLRLRLDRMRVLWKQWADSWAREFNAICRTHGFLPRAALQQRTLFDDVVRPMTQDSGAVAFFVVDAFRYEMAEELFRSLNETSRAAVHLKARLAELPTVTEVGMNVLAPVVENGRLRVVMDSAGDKILGFQAGEFRVSNPETRTRAMHDRVGGALCPRLLLDEVNDPARLKRLVKQARLLVVHSREIDGAGESGTGLWVFGPLIQQLKAAWHTLRDAGVQRFVFTADHGFLLVDPSAGAVQRHGLKRDPDRRYALSQVAVDHQDEAQVAQWDLGYDGGSGTVVFPNTTAVFDTGQPLENFVHGGNSLQERVIPVLTVVHRSEAGKNVSQYRVTTTVRPGVAGLHCVGARVESVAQRSLDFGGLDEVELALQVVEPNPGVRVELCQTRHGARLVAGGVMATVGQSFEVFFRLMGNTDERVQVELYHPSGVAQVEGSVPEARYEVEAPARGAPKPEAPIEAVPAETRSSAWLEQLPDDGVRRVFAHLLEFGAVTEAEAQQMLGGGRQLRQFARAFESYERQAPFTVRVDVVAGVKRYVREGSE